MNTSTNLDNLQLPRTINIEFTEHLLYNTGYCFKAFTRDELFLLKELVDLTIGYYFLQNIDDEKVLDFNKKSQESAREQYTQVMNNYESKKETEGYIYLVQNSHTKSLKIGFSRKPKNRINQLNTSSEFEIKLLHKFKGTVKDERKLHKKFSKHHKKLEWFSYSQAIVDYFKNI